MAIDAAVKPVELGSARAWFVWTLAVTFVVYYFSFQTGYAIVNSRVQQDIGLSVSQVATVAAVYTWIFALCQFLSGALLDRLGAGKILPVSIALVTIGIFVFANAQNYGTLLLSQLIIAVGACSGFVGAGYIGGQWFGMAKFSFMFGLVQFAASFFSAFNQNLLSLALTSIPWRELFNFIGLFGIVLFVLGAVFIRNPTPIVRPAESITTFFAAVAKGTVEVAKNSSCVGGFCLRRAVFRGNAWLRGGVGPQTVGRTRTRRRDREWVYLPLVARLGSRLRLGPQVVRHSEAPQIADHRWRRGADLGVGVTALLA